MRSKKNNNLDIRGYKKDMQLKELEELKKIETERRQLIEQEKERLIRENEELLRKYYMKGYYRSLHTLNH